MPKERSAEEVYEDLSTQGLYEEGNLDKFEIEKVKKICLEDYIFGKRLRDIENPNWRVIFNIHYDVLRELCSQLMRFKRQKISNHRGLFAFIILNFAELEMGWKFFEDIRNIRNYNKYKGLDIDKDMWKKIEFQIDLYINTIIKEIDKKINNL